MANLAVHINMRGHKRSSEVYDSMKGRMCWVLLCRETRPPRQDVQVLSKHSRATFHDHQNLHGPKLHSLALLGNEHREG